MSGGTQRRLAAIVAADVVGYSRLMGVDEAGTLSALRAHRFEIIDPLTERFGGRIVKTMGDGLLLEFPSVVAAVEFAIAMQEGTAGHNMDIADSETIRFRVGVHVGDIIVEGDDIFGNGVNIAARIEPLATPDGVSLSDDAYRQVRDRLDVIWEDGGEHEVKNIARPIKVWHWQKDLQQSALDVPVEGKSLALPDKPSIAVLPFENMSGSPEENYFAEGLTEDVITQLSRFRSLFVIHSTSSLTYKSQTPKVQDVGRELGVAYVARGSVRKVGNRVRIVVALVEAASGRQLWTERYDGDLEDIFAVQDEVTSKVVSTLAGSIDDTERLRAVRKRGDDLQAFEIVLLGEQAAREFTKDGVVRARALFQQALERDPENARAHAAMARTYLDELWSDWSSDWDAAAAQAFDWAQKAVVLDGLDNRARVNLGVAYYHCKGNFEAAQGQFAKALELNPNDADAFCLRGRCYVYAGEGDEAIASTNRSMRLSPFDSNDCNIGQFLAHYTARRYTDALASLGRIVDPAYRTDAYLAACYAQLGRDAEARKAMDAYMATAREEMAIWPGDDPKAWQRHWAQSQPFRDPADLEHLLDGFRKAGMPG